MEEHTKDITGMRSFTAPTSLERLAGESFFALS
jgi:hypothetical protein